ncbi:Glycosyl transferase family 8 [Synechococcus sp. PCC 7335]|uniref:glycosyltransferase family 8 protein n=1 Tax=Synechococcus sp. (strain ATCC 29403 / PCC 7335) TaxID=91464 RepID=UPI00017EB4B7|nr:glycosyltransferase [Synechococcus sp. PCC 7335]EDX85487.1 Glycosyl transferase family 8 [Synechococcus sp. PCC 7335]
MPVDIALSVNRTLQVPLLVVINSILTNTTHRTEEVPLRFNIVVPIGESAFFEEELKQAFSAKYDCERVEFRVKEFTPPSYLKQYLDNKFREKKQERRLSRYMQYARLFFKDVFPDIARMIYFDADIIVLGNVRSLFTQGNILTSQNYLAAVPQFFPAIFYFSNPLKVFSDLRKFKSTFNSGVLLTDLSFWTDQTYKLLKHYLELDEKNNYRLYHLGDETVFNLMFKDTYIPLTKQWNCCGYGQAHWVAKLLWKNPENMKAIHWSGGHHKPWQSKQVIYSDLWRSYIPTY